MLRHIVAVTIFRLLACPPPQLQAGLFFSSLNLKWGAIVLNCLCRDKANFGARTTQRERERGRERRRQRIQRRRRRAESEHFLGGGGGGGGGGGAEQKLISPLFGQQKRSRSQSRAEGGGRRAALSLSLSLSLYRLFTVQELK